MIVMKHAQHGIHFALSPSEADGLEKTGWRRAPEENYRFDPNAPKPDAAPAVPAQPVLKLRKG